MNMWWDKANIVASDFILSNDIISSTIQGLPDTFFRVPITIHNGNRSTFIRIFTFFNLDMHRSACKNFINFLIFVSYLRAFYL